MKFKMCAAVHSAGTVAEMLPAMGLLFSIFAVLQESPKNIFEPSLFPRPILPKVVTPGRAPAMYPAMYQLVYLEGQTELFSCARKLV